LTASNHSRVHQVFDLLFGEMEVIDLKKMARLFGKSETCRASLAAQPQKPTLDAL